MDGDHDLGRGVRIREETLSGADVCGRSGYVVGHLVDGTWCEMLVEACPPGCALGGEACSVRAAWMASGDIDAGTLSLAPSLRCRRHEGFLGYVRNGAWEPA